MGIRGSATSGSTIQLPHTWLLLNWIDPIRCNSTCSHGLAIIMISISTDASAQGSFGGCGPTFKLLLCWGQTQNQPAHSSYTFALATARKDFPGRVLDQQFVLQNDPGIQDLFEIWDLDQMPLQDLSIHPFFLGWPTLVFVGTIWHVLSPWHRPHSAEVLV